jgi:3'-phosphoadenosine 5'-phosphosulfate sulfotransferase (PAPS reductase)/FAD synthetase
MAGQLACIRQATSEVEALAAMCRLLETGHPLVVAYSGGKDSSVLANLALHAALTTRASRGRTPPIVVVHADVGSVENPEIRALVNGELAKMEDFARRLGIDLLLRIARPSLSETFAVRVVGGRGLPAFPDSRRDCSSSWKREPNDRALRTLVKEFRCQGWDEPVVMTGVRRDESTVRAGAIQARGEQSAQTWTDTEGRLRLSPLLDWTSDDVWAYLGLCRQGAMAAYSNFDDTLRIYQDAGGSSCVVVADTEMEKHAKPCASRFGCWACVAVREDRSLRQMIASHPGRYGYMQSLADLRDFISHSRWEIRRL